MNQDPDGVPVSRSEAERIRGFFKSDIPRSVALPPGIMAIDLDAHVEQAVRVNGVEQRVHAKHSQNIRAMLATPQDVLDWYFAEDPLSDGHMLTMDVSLYAGNIDAYQAGRNEAFDRFILQLRGGVTLLASVAIPEVFDDSENWYRTLNDAYYDGTGRLANGKPATAMGAQGVLELCQERVTSEGLQLHDGTMTQLFIAAEMIRSGANNLRKYANEPNVRVINWEEKDTDAFLADAMQLSYSVLHSLGIQSLSEGALADSDRFIGLRSKILSSSGLLGAASDSLDDRFKPDVPQEFSRLAKHIQSLFLDPKYGLSKHLKTNTVRGPLHEAIWFLDAAALRQLHPEQYATLAVWPSHLKGDAPKLEHPEKKLGIDYWMERGAVTEYFQLKSSRQYAKRIEHQLAAGQPAEEYHPAIMVLSEDNFEDVDPRRLQAKLDIYQRWAESGFTDEALAARVEKYILKSVKWAADYTMHQTVSRQHQLREIMFKQFIEPHIDRFLPAQPSRAQRRANPRFTTTRDPYGGKHKRRRR